MDWVNQQMTGGLVNTELGATEFFGSKNSGCAPTPPMFLIRSFNCRPIPTYSDTPNLLPKDGHFREKDIGASFFNHVHTEKRQELNLCHDLETLGFSESLSLGL